MHKFLFLFMFFLITGCASVQQDCFLFDRNSDEFKVCQAEQGSKEFQFRLGMDYFVRGDYGEAKSWFKKSAKQEASYSVRIYDAFQSGLADNSTYRDRHVEEDGNEAAAYMLFKMYEEGIGGRPNANQAERYLKVAKNKIVTYEETTNGYLVRVKSRSTIQRSSDQPPRVFDLYTFRVYVGEG